MVKVGHLRFDVWVVNLDPTVGSEIAKSRPCVIVSPDEANRFLNTVVVAPLTSTLKNYPTRVNVKFNGRVGQVALDQIRAIDKVRLVARMGKLSGAAARGVCEKLVEMFEY